MQSWTIGEVEITRVDDPGFELALPSDEATVAALQRSPWLHPHFVTDDWALRIGSSATVIRTAGHGRPRRSRSSPSTTPTGIGPRLQALREAGVEADDVDVVVNTHVDGLGVNLLHDGSPTFPRARYLVPRAEIDSIRAGDHPDLRHPEVVELHDAGAIEATGATRTSPRACGSRMPLATTRGTTSCGSATPAPARWWSATCSSTRPRSPRPRSPTATSTRPCSPRTRRALLARCRGGRLPARRSPVRHPWGRSGAPAR